MPKILWCGDAACPTGFARVTHALLDRLKAQYEVVILGVNYTGNPHDYPYKIYPAGSKGDQVGRNRIQEIALKEQVDLIVLFSDIWIVFDWWQKVQDLNIPIGVYFPIDGLGFYKQTFDFLSEVSFAATYTQFGTQVIKKSGYQGDIYVLGHGVDTNIFYQKSAAQKLKCREKFGIDPDSFIILQANRNQERKRLDLTIKIFAGFLRSQKFNPQIKLHFHCGRKDAGWPILALCEREIGPNYTQHVTTTTVGMSHPDIDPCELNDIYNTADLGINTSMGEGAGLVALEMAAVGVPSLLTKYSANLEFFESAAYLAPVQGYITDLHFGIERGLIDVEKAITKLITAYKNPSHRQRLGEIAKMRVVNDPRFSWDELAEQMGLLWGKALY